MVIDDKKLQMIEVTFTYTESKNRFTSAPAIVCYKNGYRKAQLLQGKTIKLEVKDGAQIELRMGLLGSKLVTITPGVNNYVIEATSARYFSLAFYAAMIGTVIVINSVSFSLWSTMSIITSMILVFYLIYRIIKHNGAFIIRT